MEILIQIKNKIAMPLGSPAVVCDNRDDQVIFLFDEPWAAQPLKTARFRFTRDGMETYTDVPFSGDRVTMPALRDVDRVQVGVYAGDLQTTTPAEIPCAPSIRGGDPSPEAPEESVYDQIVQLINDGALRGEPGAPGEPGAQGPVGPKGDTGPKGEKGDKGDTGDIGPQGPRGEKGEPGVLTFDALTPEQLALLKGEKGDKGDTGDTGPQGPKGDAGPEGPKGDKGDKGDAGATGPAGYTPVKGTDYCTAADKAEMVSAVLAALPTWTGGSY